LCDHLKPSWRFSEIERNKDNNLKNFLKNPLQDTFLRYLETGAKNMDSVSLRNLMGYPQLIKSYPHIYGFLGSSVADDSGLKEVFKEVVGELTAMSNQYKSKKIEIEAIEKDLLKISMKKIMSNFTKHRDVLGVLVFLDMGAYINSLDKKIINQENKDAFTAVSKVDIEEIALCSNLLEEEKLNFSRLIEKLKKDLLEVDSPLEF
jgi:dihydroxyacetone kinase DhaKLM complex PTS-EIIA-like component DhaM